MQPPQLSPLLSASPFCTKDGLFAHQPAGTACMSLWIQPVHKVRGIWGPSSCMAGLVGIPRSWHPAPGSQSCQSRGCALEVVVVAASLPCSMEALLEAEKGVYPYFCPGIGVFIASSCCSDEHCRSTLWKVLPVCWSPSGLHMHVHMSGCQHVHPHQGTHSQP